ncbi:MAG: MBL fold metallo-hydrolase [Bacteroidales bacterium]|nr:MBL fold metallo-hydrolase [Bacteroidales bacterium]
MKHWHTKKSSTIIQILRHRSNAWLILQQDVCILIDTGQASARKKLLNNLQNVLPNPLKIDFLVLTHTHYDHCQNAQFLKNMTGCKIIGSIYESKSANDGYTRIPRGTNLATKALTCLGRRLGKVFFGHESFKMDIMVQKELDMNVYGIDAKIIACPGHSEGSISLIIDDEFVIVGDTLFGIFKNTIFPPFADDVLLLFQSWNKLLDTPCNTFLPGHGKAITRERLVEAVRLRKYKHQNEQTFS